MAIDGTGIIDSDLAHDIYNEFMDLYDAGLFIDEIRKRIYQFKDELSDNLELEIFYSVLCHALWEIGELLETDYKELENYYENEQGLNEWKKLGSGIYSERKKTLQSQLKKLSKPRSKPRNRKKYRKMKKI